MKKIILLLSVVLYIFARSNPFVPAVISEVVPVSYDKKEVDTKKADDTCKNNSNKFVLMFLNDLELDFTDDKLIVKTSDKLLKNFYLKNEKKIVLDFKKRAKLKYKEIDINGINPFSKVKFGQHSEYYRIVLELDANKPYKLRKQNNQITINL